MASSKEVVKQDTQSPLCGDSAVKLETFSLTSVRDAMLEDAKKYGISDEGLSAMIAVTQWKKLLSAPSGSEERVEREYYLTTMGFIPARSQVIAQAYRSKNQVDQVYPALMAAFAKGRLDPAEFVDKSADQIKEQFPGLSKSQAELLREIMRQQRRLDLLNPAELVRQFPFPVTQNNLFGRFICGGCETPQKAIRHLQICNAFFIRMRSLLEGLSNERRSFLTISFEPEASEDPADPPEKVPNRVELDPIYDYIHACVDNAVDLTGALQIGINNKLCCIEIPRLPQAESGHIDSSEREQLAVELCDWLFYGIKTGSLLHKRSLSTEREAKYEQMVKELKWVRKSLARHRQVKPKENKRAQLERDLLFRSEAKAPHSQSPQERRRAAAHERARVRHEGKLIVWEERLHELLKRRDRLNQNIRAEDACRRRMKPILRQLEADDSLNQGLRNFRRKIREADQAGRKKCLSLLKNQQSGGIFLMHLDKAYASRKYGDRPGVLCLKSAAMLLNQEVQHTLGCHRVAGFQSLVDQQIRHFAIKASEINSSLQYLLARVLPNNPDPKVGLLIDRLKSLTPLVGIRDRKEFTYLVSKSSSKQKPQLQDYLEYAFERSAYLSQQDLVEVFGIIRELGVPHLPDRCKQIVVDRFRHSAAFVEQAQLYNQRYRPEKIGTLPPIFADQATLSSYLQLRLDAFGMQEEVGALDRHLRESGIVAIVDGTNYHPELAASGDIVEGNFESDQEQTEEVWGDYIRPAERLIRSFARRLIEGAVSEELQNHSLITVHRPDKLEKVWQALVKKMYGVKIDINPDLSQINQLLADLTVYDENTILIIDAQSVEDFEQYREFVRLLERYKLKIILRTRKPFPGVPQVLIQPFLDYELSDRLSAEADSLALKLELDRPPTGEILDFATTQVRRLRQPSADGLNLTLQLLHGAAQNLRMSNYREKVITEQDIVAAIPPIFHLPDAEQMRARRRAIDTFIEKAPLEVLGQQEAIAKIGSRMKQHILALRDPTRPLTIMLPGPTGVGKTELMIKFAQICDIPFFHIEGAEFSEHHTVFRLVGSPAGYVGDDEGILYKFLKVNTTALVFVDELEKMHPDCYQYLLNFFDKATITAGHGGTVVRPGIIIVGATNAGAEKLHREMDQRQVLDQLSDSFRDRYNMPRPELVRRFECFPMMAIERDAFYQAIGLLLQSIGSRHGFVNANLRLVGVDPTAVDLLYNHSRQVCAFDEERLKPSQMGFGKGAGEKQGTRIIMPGQGDLFYDLRHISRAVDELVGPQIQETVEQQYELGRHLERGKPRLVRLVGKAQEKRIAVEDC